MRRNLRRPLLSVLLLALAAPAVGCAPPAEEDASGSADAVTSKEAKAVLELHPLDIWAQPLPEADIKLTVKRNDQTVAITAKEITNIYLDRSASYAIHLEAPEHESLDLVFDYDDGEGAGKAGLTLTTKDKQGAGVTMGDAQRTVDGRKLPAHAVYAGLRHKWFSAEARPARRGNEFKLMMDGEEAWKTVHADLSKAKRQIHLATWWWESDFELIRPIAIARTAEQRFPDTIMGVLEKTPAERRVLVGQFWGQDGILSDVNTDGKLRYYADRANDRFEMMGQANTRSGQFVFSIPNVEFHKRVQGAFVDAPKQLTAAPVASRVTTHVVDLAQLPLDISLEAGSYHQKFIVVDDQVAFIGGMNMKSTDWDTSRHDVYDWRRMKFDASESTRQQVVTKTRAPDLGPRKDYMVRIEGPAAQDAADVFKKRWDHLKSIKATHSENATSFDVQREIAPRAGGIQVQVTATLPQPFWEHGIAETWFNAVQHAEEYIYIEDQYFRVPMLNASISRRMDENPNLKLVVITKNVGTNVPDCYQTALQHEFFRGRYSPSRYMLMQLRAYDFETGTFADMDVHSKMLIVDDKFMSIGSANKNNRGLVYEAELNAAVVDKTTVQGARKRILANILGTKAADQPEAVEQWWPLLVKQASKNELLRLQNKGASPPADQRPVGFAYPLTDLPASNTCKLQSAGPDQY